MGQKIGPCEQCPANKGPMQAKFRRQEYCVNSAPLGCRNSCQEIYQIVAMRMTRPRQSNHTQYGVKTISHFRLYKWQVTRASRLNWYGGNGSKCMRVYTHTNTSHVCTLTSRRCRCLLLLLLSLLFLAFFFFFTLGASPSDMSSSSSSSSGKRPNTQTHQLNHTPPHSWPASGAGCRL